MSIPLRTPGCGCGDCSCADCGPASPSARPSPGSGLDALSFRIGTHGQFLQALLTRLSSSGAGPLTGLRTRDLADPTVALLDAWATLADILTFYGERVLNEGYLRTATEAFSVEALARLVGYAPRPGLAASLHLAYTLETGHEDVLIPVGSRSQSVPAPGELPQTFETSDALLAQAGLSVMRARLTRPPLILSDQIENRDYFLKGLGGNLRPNDTLLFTFGTGGKPARALMDVHTAELDAPHGRTRVTLHLHEPHPQVKPAKNLVSSLHSLLDSEHLAELNLKAEMGSVQRLNSLVERYAQHPIDAERAILSDRLTVEGTSAARQGWKNVSALIQELLGKLDVQVQQPAGDNHISVVTGTKNESPFTRILGELRKAPSVQPATGLLLNRDARQLIGGQNDSMPRLYAALYPRLKPQLYAALGSAQVAPEAALTTVDALRVKAGLFGANIPQSVVRDPPAPTMNFRSAWADLLGIPQENLLIADLPFQQDVIVLALNGDYPQIKVGSWIAVERPQHPGQGWGQTRELSFHQVKKAATLTVSADLLAYTARSTVLEVDPPWLKVDTQVAGNNWLPDRRLLRETTVYAAPEPLELMPEVIELPVGEDDEIELDDLYRGLEPGRFVILDGERDDLTATRLPDAELGMISSVKHRLARTPDGLDWPGDTLHTFVRLAAPLKFRFRRDTLVIHGNVVRASHGETRPEVLGDGDARSPAQVFTLKQGPLTYLPAVTPRGAQSTLTVRVNGLRWTESPRPQAGRRYTLSTDAAGKTSIRFGSRLPTGRENITASYRSGLGRTGNVAARQVTLLMSKPLGVKGIVNPLRASGGADREDRDQIRHNAPLVTMALDRLVSVRDYQDFARTFAGVGKARATRFAAQGRPTVHLTLAGADDAPIDPGSDLARTLRAALRRYGDPAQAVQVGERTLRLLVVQADVEIDADWLWKDVEARLRQALLERFGFEARELAQGIAQSEVLSIMQRVPGVVAIRLSVLDSVGETELQLLNQPSLKLRTGVPAQPARSGPASGFLPAELLILTPEVADTLVLRPWTQGA